jgi:hypothetical protein
MAIAILLFYTLVLPSDRTSFSLKVPEHLYGLIVRLPSPSALTVTDLPWAGSSLCLFLLLSHPLVCRPSYEIFPQTHQALAALSACAGWRHLPSHSLFPRRSGHLDNHPTWLPVAYRPLHDRKQRLAETVLPSTKADAVDLEAVGFAEIFEQSEGQT